MAEIDVFAAEEGGEPVYREQSLRLPNGGAFAGWYRLQRQDRPFVVTAHHGLDTIFYTLQFWFWGGGGDSPNHHSWSGRQPQPDEAGPAEIVTTANFLYFHFQPDKPVFSLFDPVSGGFRPLDSGWIGALVVPG